MARKSGKASTGARMTWQPAQRSFLLTLRERFNFDKYGNAAIFNRVWDAELRAAGYTRGFDPDNLQTEYNSGLLGGRAHIWKQLRKSNQNPEEMQLRADFEAQIRSLAVEMGYLGAGSEEADAVVRDDADDDSQGIDGSMLTTDQEMNDVPTCAAARNGVDTGAAIANIGGTNEQTLNSLEIPRRPLTLLSLPSKILIKILIHVMQVVLPDGSRQSLPYQEMQSHLGWQIEPISFNLKLYRVALEAFLEANVFYIELGPALEIVSNDPLDFKVSSYGFERCDDMLLRVVRHVDLRVELSGLVCESFNIRETDRCVEAIVNMTTELKQRLPKVKTASIWLSCDTEDGAEYLNHGVPVDRAVFRASDTIIPFIENQVPSAVAKQYGIFYAAARILDAAADYGLYIHSVAFEDGWDTVKETVDLRHKRYTMSIVRSISHERNKGKQFRVRLVKEKE